MDLNADGLEFWIPGHTVVYEEAARLSGLDQPTNKGLWYYPAGAMVTKTIPKSGSVGLTVSLGRK